MTEKYNVILLAAGSSVRFKHQQSKIFYKINGEYVIKHSVNLFLEDKQCSKIIITANQSDFDRLRKMFCLYSKILVVYGGSTRNESVRNAVKYLNKDNQFVLIHDAARPYVSETIINDVKYAIFSNEFDAITTYVDIYDSIIQIENNNINYINRDEFKIIQTPQAFKQVILQTALNQTNDINFNDEFSLVKQYLQPKIKLVYGSKKNIKITTLDDLSFTDIE